MRDERVTDTAAFDRDDLMATLEAAWAPFTLAVETRRGPFHTPTIATVGHGLVPGVRTIVLRHCDARAWTLRFHTDRRSQKYREISANPAIAFHVYSQQAKLQVKLLGHARLHCEDAVAGHAWASSLPASQECYAQGPAPGQVLPAPGPDRAPPSGRRLPQEAGRENFCAVQVQVHLLEWLYLRAAGHRRARFERGSAGAIDAVWLAP